MGGKSRRFPLAPHARIKTLGNGGGSGSFSRQGTTGTTRMTVITHNPTMQRAVPRRFLTATPVADFMAARFGSIPPGRPNAAKDRWGLLVKAIIEKFGARWCPDADVLGICDKANKGAHVNTHALAALGVTLDSAAKIPDVIVHDTKRNWLLLIEAVTSAGPVDGKRRKGLKDLFADRKAGLVFVTAFENRRTMQTFASQIAWESEVWIAEDPDHMIHFNGERFLGPYPDVMPKS